MDGTSSNPKKIDSNSFLNPKEALSRAVSEMKRDPFSPAAEAKAIAIAMFAVPIFLILKTIVYEVPMGAIKIITGVVLSPLQLYDLLKGKKVHMQSYSIIAPFMHLTRIVAFVGLSTASPFVGLFISPESVSHMLNEALSLNEKWAGYHFDKQDKNPPASILLSPSVAGEGGSPASTPIVEKGEHSLSTHEEQAVPAADRVLDELPSLEITQEDFNAFVAKASTENGKNNEKLREGQASEESLQAVVRDCKKLLGELWDIIIIDLPPEKHSKLIDLQNEIEGTLKRAETKLSEEIITKKINDLEKEAEKLHEKINAFDITNESLQNALVDFKSLYSDIRLQQNEVRTKDVAISTKYGNDAIEKLIELQKKISAYSEDAKLSLAFMEIENEIEANQFSLEVMEKKIEEITIQFNNSERNIPSIIQLLNFLLTHINAMQKENMDLIRNLVQKENTAQEENMNVPVYQVDVSKNNKLAELNLNSVRLENLNRAALECLKKSEKELVAIGMENASEKINDINEKLNNARETEKATKDVVEDLKSLRFSIEEMQNKMVEFPEEEALIHSLIELERKATSMKDNAEQLLENMKFQITASSNDNLIEEFEGEDEEFLESFQDPSKVEIGPSLPMNVTMTTNLKDVDVFYSNQRILEELKDKTVDRAIMPTVLDLFSGVLSAIRFKPIRTHRM